jgi:hypothetical protein
MVRGILVLRSKASVICSPLNEVLPEDDPMKYGKARKMEPATRRRIRDASTDGKFLGVQGLI